MATKAPEQSVSRSGYIDAKTAAGLLMMSTERVRQLVKDGWIPKPDRNQYPLVGTVQGYINFLRDEARRSVQNVSANKARDARAREIEVRTDERLRKLVPFDEANTVVAEVVGTYRSEYAGLAAKVTRDPAQRQAIQKAVDEAQGRITVLLAERLAALRDGRPVVPADAEDDA